MFILQQSTIIVTLLKFLKVKVNGTFPKRAGGGGRGEAGGGSRQTELGYQQEAPTRSLKIGITDIIGKWTAPYKDRTLSLQHW